MKKPKLTPWFSGKVKPMRSGVYERDYCKVATFDKELGIVFAYWDGRRWGLYGITPHEAVKWKGVPSLYRSLPWRGIAKQTKA